MREQQRGRRLPPTGQVYGVSPYGWLIGKGSALALPIQAGMQALIGDGTYTAMCAKWGNEGGQLAHTKTKDAQR